MKIMHLRFLPLNAALALLLACTVGPDYKGPPEVARQSLSSKRFERAPVAPVVANSPPARWWEAINDPVLTRLIDDAIAASPSLQSAAARVRSARAQLVLNRTNLLPTGSADARYVRARIPTGTVAPSSGGTTSSIPDPLKLNLYSLSTDATWELDVFGGTRRGIESASATAEARQAAFEDAKVQLASDVAQAYVQLREVQDRVAFARQTIDLRSQIVVLTQQRQQAGTASVQDLDRLASELAQARATLPALQADVEQQLDQLAILTGREPGAVDTLLHVAETEMVTLPVPPELVPVGEPADWLRRRPDIREAERTLASRTATIGQNVAEYFPTVSVLGLIATSGAKPRDLFRGTPLSVIEPSLSWNFLSIPKTRAKVAGAEADRDEALSDYERIVLAALQDANDSLSRFGRRRQALMQRVEARQASARVAQFTRQRYAAGTASLIDALDTERQRVQTDDDWIQAQADLTISYVTLQKSLGLGWESVPPTIDPAMKKAPQVP